MLKSRNSAMYNQVLISVRRWEIVSYNFTQEYLYVVKDRNQGLKLVGMLHLSIGREANQEEKETVQNLENGQSQRRLHLYGKLALLKCKVRKSFILMVSHREDLQYCRSVSIVERWGCQWKSLEILFVSIGRVCTWIKE